MKSLMSGLGMIFGLSGRENLKVLELRVGLCEEPPHNPEIRPSVLNCAFKTINRNYLMTFEEIRHQLVAHSTEHSLIKKAKESFELVLASCINGEAEYKKALKVAVNGAFGFEDIEIVYHSQTFCFHHESIGNLMIYTNFKMVSRLDKDAWKIGHYIYITDEHGNYFDESFFIYGYHV